MHLGNRLSLFILLVVLLLNILVALLLLPNCLVIHSKLKVMDNTKEESTSETDRPSSDQSLSSSPADTDNNLAIVTAISANHLLEGVAMLRTLIAVQFKGPVFIFLMATNSGEDVSSRYDEFKEELLKSPLQLQFIDMEVQSNTLNAGTYCFKPTAMGVYLRHNSLLPLHETAKVVMWSDASTRFLQNPSMWANYMVQNDIDFIGRRTIWSIPQQTHVGTFEYFDMKPHDFDDHPSIASGHFLINLKREKSRMILHRWVDCGVLDCHTCMAPIGSSKRDPNGAKYKGRGNDYVSHRQDQSVLTLLVTDYMKKYESTANVKIIRGPHPSAEAPYFCLQTMRSRGDIKSVKDWNTTFTTPPDACKTPIGKILKISSNGTIAWEDDK